MGEKAETLKRERTSSEAMTPDPKRMAPETRDSDGGSCSLKPKTLTDDMLEQLRVVQTHWRRWCRRPPTATAGGRGSGGGGSF